MLRPLARSFSRRRSAITLGCSSSCGASVLLAASPLLPDTGVDTDVADSVAVPGLFHAMRLNFGRALMATHSGGGVAQYSDGLRAARAACGPEDGARFNGPKPVGL